jgi:hypothetical protein
VKTRGNALIVKATGRRIPLYACKRPTFRRAFGRTWDYSVLTLEGQPLKFWWDTTWGTWAYAQFDGRWLKCAVADIESNYHTEVTLEA